MDVRRAAIVTEGRPRMDGIATRFGAPRRIATLLADFPQRWAFAGGWAVDLYLGRETREHKDVDVAILRRDQALIRAYLSERGWSLEKAHDGRLTPWAPGEYLELPIHVVWCRNASHDPDFLELVLDEATATDFQFRRDRSITLLLERAFLTSSAGLPILAPEIALLYKAGHHEEAGNASDFVSALPVLDAAQRAWLRVGIGRPHPGHPWLSAM